MSFDFFPNEQSAALLAASRRPSTTPEPGAFKNFLPGAASYGMRSLAEVGRAVDLAGSVFPIAVDAVTGGTERQDQYFREHDDVFNGAVDHWTPRPGEVGAAGQVAGQLAGGVLQAIISPAVLVGPAQLSTSEELVRQGVDAGAANVVGDIAGIGAAVGVKLPFLGQSLTTRVLSGSAGNVVQGAATAGASRAVLDAAGAPAQVAAQYDATDLRARLLDAMLGAAFGGLAHGLARTDAKLSAVDDAALLVANQARHLETTARGQPVTDIDVTQHVAAMRQALDQTLRGEPVSVDKTVEGMRVAGEDSITRDRAELAGELTRAAGEEVPPAAPVRPVTDDTPLRDQQDGAPVDAPLEEAQAESAQTGDMIQARARAALAKSPDMLIPDPARAVDGETVSVRAADVLQRLRDEHAESRATAPDVFKTAAACLLGVL